MADVVVVYNTVTGFAQTYGEWIAEDLGARLYPWSQAKGVDLSGANLVVYGAGVRMSRIRGFHEFRRKIKRENLMGKVVVWANGGTPVHPQRDWRVPAGTFTKKELASGCYPFFYFQGGVRYEGLSFPEKTLLKIFSKRIQRYRHRGEWVVQVADNIAHGYDHTSRAAIIPLVNKAREMLGE